jgi:hypothetical protein
MEKHPLILPLCARVMTIYNIQVLAGRLSGR